MRRVQTILAACVLGCGNDAAHDSAGASTTTAATTLELTTIPTTGEPKLDLAGADSDDSPCGPHGGGALLSSIWIANSTQGTISKIDTESLQERGRYIVRPDSAGNPSRTSVNLAGDVAVANRNGGITKVFALAERCHDSNGEPGVQTAADGEFLPWGVEECIAWYTPMTYVSQRPVAWTRGDVDADTCAVVGAKLWTAGMNTPGTVDILRLNGDTGELEAKVTIENMHVDNYGIYGAAVDAHGNFWGSQVGQAKLVRVEYESLEYKVWDLPVGAYGITVDSQGYVWTCAGHATRFDPATEEWTVADAGEYGGCMEDGAGTLYKAAPGGIAAVDTTTLAVKRTYALPQHIHGISVDFNGHVWGVSQGTDAYRLDPVDGSFETVTGLVGAYTYSDMTGFALSRVPVP